VTEPAVWRRGEPPYPPALEGIRRPPDELYALGDPGMLDGPCVALVGTRRATGYGERVTRALAAALAEAGVCVVSGMATGVDGIAHRAALAAGGRTVAVLGAGIDRIYPPANTRLYHELVERALVVAEFPPGTPAFAGCFPRRNRIIAGLAVATFVVEAGHRSGALITAGHALDAGRAVAAVPGMIDAPQSAGTNQLLRDGAHVIASVADALTVAGIAAGGNRGIEPARATPPLDPDEALVRDRIAAGATSTDAVVEGMGWAPTRCLVAISGLELKGVIRAAAGGALRLA